MKPFAEISAQVDHLSAILGAGVDSVALPSTIAALDDEQVIDILAAVSALVKAAEPVRVAAAGVVAERSTRGRGHSGLAQVRGHRSPVSLVQQITGSTRGDAAKNVRLGESLLNAIPAAPEPGDVADPGEVAGVQAAPVWHHVLGDALLDGRLTSAQHDAILRGLGEPPAPEGTDEDAAGDDERAVAAAIVADAARQAWQAAAEQLIEAAGDRTVEDLLRDARTCRDMLDTAGAARRFEERYRARSFRMWVDADGIHRAHLSLDDEAAVWVRTIIDSALRPRRGGPRFVDPADKERAQELLADPRRNDQLAYDLIIATLRAGALADAKDVFGARQPGVRVVVTHETLTGERDAFGRLTGIGFTEDGGYALPAGVIEKTLCESGVREAIVDAAGNPLDLGREQRLFSARQRIALAIRDGGCLWGDCTMPASYCEAHHCDHWYEDGGRTDIDRGLLLCAFHHLHLHNGGWRIARTGRSDFVLHPPPDVGGEPIPLRSKSPLRFMRALAPPGRAATPEGATSPDNAPTPGGRIETTGNTLAAAARGAALGGSTRRGGGQNVG